MKGKFNNNNHRFNNNGGNFNNREKFVFPEEAKKYQAKNNVVLDIIRATGAFMLFLVGLCYYFGKKTDDAINAENNKK